VNLEGSGSTRIAQNPGILRGGIVITKLYSPGRRSRSEPSAFQSEKRMDIISCLVWTTGHDKKRFQFF
jgi:hypothetical protein